MWFWQKHEVYMSADGEKAQRVVQALADAGIAAETEYHNGHNIAGAGSRSFGSIGRASASTALYYVYVHKKVAAAAEAAAAKALRG